MHRYADLNRNRNSRLTRLEGNLVVANRKRSGKREKVRIDSQFILWAVILIMFTVSGLYIRYQALYVEDSVFRDAYLLINEHFLTKKPLPSPNLLPNGTFTTTQTPDFIPKNINSENNNLSATVSAGVGNTTIANTTIEPNASLNQNNLPVQSQLSQVAIPQQVTSQPQQIVVQSADPVQQNREATIPNSLVGNSSIQQIQYGLTAQPSQVGINSTFNNSANNNVITPPQVLPPTPPTTTPKSLPKKSKVFSYYQPILNSKSTKVGFFVVNKKTEYSDQYLYQSLFKNLLVFQSSNPKVKNFFDPKTRLNDAWIENDTLLLDFNSAFENSKYGYMGVEAKIQQILWTFFNFNEDSINKISYISFLIDGKRKENIGGDGKILKPFYSRKDLKSVITL